MNLGKGLVSGVAKKYNLSSNEDDIFDICWKIKKYGEKFAKENPILAENLINQGFDLFVKAVRTGEMSDQLGHSRLKKLPVEGSYVIFSDHHLAHSNNRQNFMQTSGNLDLYTDVLKEYLHSNFILIENGDVEELLIFEPTEAEMQSRLDILKDGGGLTDESTLSELNQRRQEKRLVELRRIVEDPANEIYYKTLNEFSEQQRLIRVTGNHDYDLQKPVFLEVMQEKVHNLSAPYDYVFLTNNKINSEYSVHFAIMHGHQFDTSCVPELAPKLGELFSESLSWAFQGADRTWSWRDSGRCIKWVEQNDLFLNNLVTDDYGKVWGGKVAAYVGAKITNLDSQEGWEQLFGHNIAWEYFENSDPQDAVNNEVERGKGFFKFRHLDEEFLRERLISAFPDATIRPKLLLGHSHEVRHNPAFMNGSPEERESTFHHYLNSGAAGRFENLIWGIEIINGEETVVSWSRPLNDKTKRPERRVYSPLELSEAVGNALQSGENPVNLSKPSVWLPQMLHTMMS